MSNYESVKGHLQMKPFKNNKGDIPDLYLILTTCKGDKLSEKKHGKIFVILSGLQI